LGSLLENAARYARSMVCVRVERGSMRGEVGEWVVIVEDDGAGWREEVDGVKKDERGEGRGERGGERLPQAGLGLRAAEEIITALGGHLGRARSLRFGGAAVRVVLPQAIQWEHTNIPSHPLNNDP
ncbi:MAG: ATP-binding protein, partial [Hydrogenophilus sp.]|nr:ATP-binding protein [Hydrogenophilus sp.]